MVSDCRDSKSTEKSLSPDDEKSSSSEPTSQKSSKEEQHEQQSEKDPEAGQPVSGIADTQKNETATETTSHDPDLVDWEPADTPEKPHNWTKKKKWGSMAIVSAITFLTPLASSMVAPGVPLIMQDYHTRNQTIGSFIVSIYVLGYALGPLFIAPLSEVYGRLPVYHVCNVMFLIWTIACALAPNVASILVFRTLAGIAGSCPITIGGGSIADLFTQQERGAAMALFALGPLFGPVIGPVAGGYLSEAKGWRWTFWVIAIASGVMTVLGIVLMRETYEPILLERRVKKLRKETGNQNLRSKLDPGLPKKDYFLRAIVRPTKMLLFSPIILIFSIYMAVVYGYLYLLFTTLTLVFESIYHFSQGSIGLTFLGIGVGSLLGLFIFGSLSDRLIRRMAKGGELKPEYRIPPLIPGSLCIPVGLFWYGWSAQNRVHWMMPIIGTSFVGLGMISTFMTVQTYMVDAFAMYAASAIAANTVLRSAVGAFLPLAGPKMYRTLGLGWGNSLLAFIALAMAPVTYLFYKYGERIRKSKRFQVQF